MSASRATQLITLATYQVHLLKYNVRTHRQISIYRYKDDESVKNIMRVQSFLNIMSDYLMNQKVCHTWKYSGHLWRNNFWDKVILSQNQNNDFKHLWLWAKPVIKFLQSGSQIFMYVPTTVFWAQTKNILRRSQYLVITDSPLSML